MSRKFRLTCARTTYFEVELEAEDVIEAERALEASLSGDRSLREQSRILGRPVHRVVEVAVAEEDAAAGVAHAA